MPRDVHVMLLNYQQLNICQYDDQKEIIQAYNEAAYMLDIMSIEDDETLDYDNSLF